MTRPSFQDRITFERLADEGETALADRVVEDARNSFRARRTTSLCRTETVASTGAEEFDWLDKASPFAQADF